MLGVVLGSYDVTRHKPHPEGILKALERMGVSKEEFLYCGDTVLDAEAAQRAGVDFAAVLNGTTPGEAFRRGPAVRGPGPDGAGPAPGRLAESNRKTPDATGIREFF